MKLSHIMSHNAHSASTIDCVLPDNSDFSTTTIRHQSNRILIDLILRFNNK